MIVKVEQLVEWGSAGELEYFEETRPIVTLYSTNPTWPAGDRLPELRHNPRIGPQSQSYPPVCLCVKHSSGAQAQIFIAVRQLRVCWSGALSLTRGQVCRLQLLLALANEFSGPSHAGLMRNGVEVKFTLRQIDSLCSLGTDRIENTAFNTFSIAAWIVCLTMALVLCSYEAVA
jgi:hypothetical protein